jgi:hypothetical protein
MLVTVVLMTFPMIIVFALPIFLMGFVFMMIIEEYDYGCPILGPCIFPVMLCAFNCGCILNVCAIPIALLFGPCGLCFLVADYLLERHRKN